MKDNPENIQLSPGSQAEKMLQALDALGIVDQHGDIVFVNNALSKLTGFPAEEILGKKVESLVPVRFVKHHELRGRYSKNPVRRAMGSGLVVWMRHRDGTELPVEISLNPMETPRGTATLFLVRDAQTRVNTEADLLQHTSLLESYFDAGLVGMLISTPGRELLQFNDRFCEITGYSREEMKSVGWSDVTHPEDQLTGNERYLALLTGQADKLTRVKRYIRKDGGIVHVVIRTKCIRDEGGDVKYLVSFVQDITEQKQAEATIVSQNERLRLLTAHLQDLREKERQAVARDLHDDLGQRLAAINMDLNRLRAQLPARETELRVELSRIIDDTASLGDEVRRICMDMRPMLLDDLGLVPALDSLLQEWSKRGAFAFHFSYPDVPLPRNPQRDITAFRVCQELLTNVVRHSGAESVTLNMEIAGPNLFISLRDSGIGIGEIVARKDESLGLLGIEERIRSCGGSLAIRREEPEGTAIQVTLPLDPGEMGAES